MEDIQIQDQVNYIKEDPELNLADVVGCFVEPFPITDTDNGIEDLQHLLDIGESLVNPFTITNTENGNDVLEQGANEGASEDTSIMVIDIDNEIQDSEQGANEGASEDTSIMAIDIDNVIQDSEEAASTPENNLKRKRSYCPYCVCPVSDFTRHITTFHKSEEEVKEYLQIADEDILVRKKRQTEITNILQNKGILLYNSMLEGTENTEILSKGSPNTGAADNRAYVECRFCHGTFKKNTLYNHFKACSANTNKCGLLFKPGLSEDFIELKEKVSKFMSGDNVSLTAQNDPLILSLGSQIYTDLEDGKETYRIKSVCTEMRDLAKILISMKEKNENVYSFEDCLTPACFEDLMDFVKQLSSCKDGNGVLLVPTLPIRVSKSLETCSDILKSKIDTNTTLQTQHKQSKLQMIDEFLILLKTKWMFSLESLAENNLREASPDPDNSNDSDSDEVHADPVDIAVAFNYIMRKYDSAIKELKENPTFENYKILSKYCIAHIMIVNGRHPEEVTCALVTHYQLRSLNELPEAIRLLLISKEQLKQVGSLDFFQVPGKTLKVVPCHLTKNMKKAVNTLLKVRSILKITSKYLFPKPTQFGKCSLFSGTQIIDELSSILKDYLENPKSFTAIGVLNYVQTSSQMMDVGLVRRTYFSIFLGDVEATKSSETNTIKGFQSKSNKMREFDTVLTSNSSEKLLVPQSQTSHDTSPVQKRKMSEEKELTCPARTVKEKKLHKIHSTSNEDEVQVQNGSPINTNNEEESVVKEASQIPENESYPLLAWPDLPKAIANLEQVFLQMSKKDNVTQVAQNDPLIVCFGSKGFTSRTDEKRTKHVLVWMRDLAKILISMKERNNNIRAFEDCFMFCYFNDLTNCIKQLCKYDEAKRTMYRPSVMLRLAKSLKNCANILGDQIEKETTVPTIRTKSGSEFLNDFLFLVKLEWKHLVESIAKESLRKRSETFARSHSADVVLAFNYIMSVYDSLIYNIKESPTSTNYAALAKHCIAHIIILNGCWPGEITRALLEHYQVKDANEINIEQRYRLWTDKEKEQVGDIGFFRVPGKVKKEVSCLLTKKMKEAVDTLIATRNTLKITSDYLFARPRAGNCLEKYEFYNGTHIIDEFNTVLKDQLKDAENFTAAGVRAHVEYQRCQSTNNERSRTYLRTFLGDDETAEPLVTNVSKACQSESNNKEDSDTDDDSISCDEEYRFLPKEDSDESDSDLPRTKTTPSRVRWTDEEKEVLYKHFGKQLLEHKQPRRKDIKDVVEMEPALFNRTLNQVCSYINNIVTQKSKLPRSVIRQLRQRYS